MQGKCSTTKLHTSPDTSVKGGDGGGGAGFCFVFSIALAFDPLTLSEHKHQIDLAIGWHLAPQLAPCG